MASIDVEEVTGGKALTRFTDLPRALHGHDPRFAPPVMAWERYRVDRFRNPYLGDADWAFLMVRRMGRPAGRIAVHLPRGSTGGRFGLWSCLDEPGVAAALVEAAVLWLEERGATSIEGPWSFQPGDDHGLLVDGFEAPGTTGRPWSPGTEAALLHDALSAYGEVDVADEVRLWRVPTTEAQPALPQVPELPGQAGPYVDPRLSLAGIAAVPDLSAALRSTGIRGAWSLARRARHHDWDGCTTVSCAGDPAVAGPALLGAAGRAGYTWALVPWSPDPDARPETVHRRHRVAL